MLPPIRALIDSETSHPDDFGIQQNLHNYYTSVLSEPADFKIVPTDISVEARIRMIEDKWNAYEVMRVSRHPLPADKDEFLDWYGSTAKQHKSDTDILFQFLAEQATLEQMAFFIVLEEEVDSRFEDLIAMAQIGVAGQSKLTIAENYWDEMGNGSYEKIHMVMFGKSVAHMKNVLAVQGIETAEHVPVEALKNANMLMMYGIRRQYNPRLIGALGILELTAPDRFQAMVDGCRRIAVPEEVMRYQAVHVGVDQEHAAEWMENVLIPLISTSSDLMREICLGIMIRYRIATDYYRAVRRAIDILPVGA